VRPHGFMPNSLFQIVVICEEELERKGKKDGENGDHFGGDWLIAHVPRACILGPDIHGTHVQKTNLMTK
jgi:hypothetical protein